MNKIQSLYLFVNKYTIIGTILLVVLIISIKFLNSPKKSEESEVIRPVRTIIVEHQLTKKSLSLTGEILAKNELDLSFRIDGKLIQRLVSIGDLVSVEGCEPSHKSYDYFIKSDIDKNGVKIFTDTFQSVKTA